MRQPARAVQPLTMRICLYTNTALPLMGGQEHVVDALARQFTRSNQNVTVLAPRLGRCARSDHARPYPVVRHPPFISTRRFVNWYGRFLERLHRREGFDVIHCHSVYPAGFIAVGCRESLRCPVVITGHGEHTSARRLENPVLRRRFSLAVQRADALIAISDSIREGYLTLDSGAANRIVDIPNGVDVDMLARPVARPIELPDSIEPEHYFLFMGRLKPRKGADVLIDAYAQASVGNTTLAIAGDGPERGSLEDLARARGCSDRVHFAGAVSGDLKSYLYQNSLALVAPSRVREGQPLVVLESFAAGRPVIASDMAGFRDLVRPGHTGFLVPPESPEPLARALEEACADPAPLDAMHEAVRGVVEPNSWRCVAARHMELYERITAPQRC